MAAFSLTLKNEKSNIITLCDVQAWSYRTPRVHVSRARLFNWKRSIPAQRKSPTQTLLELVKKSFFPLHDEVITFSIRGVRHATTYFQSDTTDQTKVKNENHIIK